MKPPRPITAGYLERVVQHYLERYFTTRGHLRRLLAKRVDRSIAHHGGERDELMRLVDDLLDRLERTGVLNDELYTESKVRSIVRRGGSRQKVLGKLVPMGVPSDKVQEALDALEVDPTLAAACAYVRRRRLGPYRFEDRQAERDRDLAKLGRAGFSWQVAKRVLDIETVEELERHLLG